MLAVLLFLGLDMFENDGFVVSETSQALVVTESLLVGLFRFFIRARQLRDGGPRAGESEVIVEFEMVAKGWS